ncbi:MAG: hypothetical protein AAGA54_09530, partial [Myxococcota bacterium]
MNSLLALAGLALGLGAACNNAAEGGGNSCIAGQVNFCPCPGDAVTSPSGTQTCLADGTYGLCQCGGDPTVGATDSASGTGSDTAESDSDSNGSSGEEPDLCGNGWADLGECDIGPDGSSVPCPEDCQSDSESESDSDTDGDTDDSAGGDTSGGQQVCQVYAGMVPASASVWTHPGFGDGFTSGTQACIAAGYPGVCTYTQLQQASDQAEFG